VAFKAVLLKFTRSAAKRLRDCAASDTSTATEGGGFCGGSNTKNRQPLATVQRPVTVTTTGVWIWKEDTGASTGFATDTSSNASCTAAAHSMCPVVGRFSETIIIKAYERHIKVGERC